MSRPKPVTALATSGSKKRPEGAPSTPIIAFIMILIARSACLSPRRLACSRRSPKRVSTSGRIATVREKRAPLGATSASAPATACASGSRLNVRIRLGYRLLKSNTATFRNTPGCDSMTAPPDTRPVASRSRSTDGATRPRWRSSGR